MHAQSILWKPCTFVKSSDSGQSVDFLVALKRQLYLRISHYVLRGICQ